MPTETLPNQPKLEFPQLPIEFKLPEVQQGPTNFIHNLDIITNTNEKERIKVSFQPGRVDVFTRIPNPSSKEYRDDFYKQFNFVTAYKSGYAPFEIQQNQEKELATAKHFIKTKQSCANGRLKRVCGVSYVKKNESQQLNVNHIFPKLLPLVFQGSHGCSYLTEYEELLKQAFDKIVEEGPDSYFLVTHLDAEDEGVMREYLYYPERRVKLAKGKVYLVRSLDALWHLFKDKSFICIHLVYDTKEFIRKTQLEGLSIDQVEKALITSNIQLGILCRRSLCGKQSFLRAFTEGTVLEAEYADSDDDIEVKDLNANEGNPETQKPKRIRSAILERELKRKQNRENKEARLKERLENKEERLKKQAEIKEARLKEKLEKDEKRLKEKLEKEACLKQNLKLEEEYSKEKIKKKEFMKEILDKYPNSSKELIESKASEEAQNNKCAQPLTDTQKRRGQRSFLKDFLRFLYNPHEIRVRVLNIKNINFEDIFKNTKLSATQQKYVKGIYSRIQYYGFPTQNLIRDIFQDLAEKITSYLNMISDGDLSQCDEMFETFKGIIPSDNIYLKENRKVQESKKNRDANAIKSEDTTAQSLLGIETQVALDQDQNKICDSTVLTQIKKERKKRTKKTIIEDKNNSSCKEMAQNVKIEEMSTEIKTEFSTIDVSRKSPTKINNPQLDKIEVEINQKPEINTEIETEFIDNSNFTILLEATSPFSNLVLEEKSEEPSVKSTIETDILVNNSPTTLLPEINGPLMHTISEQITEESKRKLEDETEFAKENLPTVSPSETNGLLLDPTNEKTNQEPQTKSDTEKEMDFLPALPPEVKESLLYRTVRDIKKEPGINIITSSLRVELYTPEVSWKTSDEHTKNLLYTFIMYITEAMIEKLRKWTLKRIELTQDQSFHIYSNASSNDIKVYEIPYTDENEVLSVSNKLIEEENWVFNTDIKAIESSESNSLTVEIDWNDKNLKKVSLSDIHGDVQRLRDGSYLTLPLYSINTRDSFAFDLVEKITEVTMRGRKVIKTEFFFCPDTLPTNFNAFKDKFPDYYVGVTTYNDFFSHEELQSIETSCYNTERAFFNDHYLPMTGQMTSTNEKVRRTKFFFGARYMWTKQQISEPHSMVGAGIRVDVSDPPKWMKTQIENPMVEAGILEKDFINSIAMNVYHDGKEGIAQHFDDAVRFKQPIYSLRIFSDSRLSFGSQLYGFCNGAFCIPMPRGCITVMDEGSYAANGIKHCVRPCDMTGKSAALIMRQMHHKVFSEAKVYNEFVDFPTWFSTLSIDENAVSYTDQKRIEAEELIKLRKEGRLVI